MPLEQLKMILKDFLLQPLAILDYYVVVALPENFSAALSLLN